MDTSALTVSETANLLGVDPATVRAWARTGRLQRRDDVYRRGSGKTVFEVRALLAPSLPPTPKMNVAVLTYLMERAA